MLLLRILPKSILTLAVCAVSLLSAAQSSAPIKGSLISQKIVSAALAENKIGLDLNRNISIYLPPGYETSGRFYPVVYLLHSIFSDNDRLVRDSKITELLDRAFNQKVIHEFILVVPDYRTATTGSLYDNSTITGRWLDYTFEEVIPMIDRKFRTVPKNESRAIVGEFMGGRGALKMAMMRPDIFGAVYALNPIATGMGKIPWSYTQIDWKKIYAAKSYGEGNLDGISQIFVTVSQTYLPNPDKPPFYCDFFMEPDEDGFRPNPAHMIKAQKGFCIGETLADYADNLRQLNGVALDWARFDPIHAHVDSNREFSRRLEDLGISHDAEEYSGAPFEKHWQDNGRFYTRVLPFLAQKLQFESQ